MGQTFFTSYILHFIFIDLKFTKTDILDKNCLLWLTQLSSHHCLLEKCIIFAEMNTLSFKIGIERKELLI